LIQGETILKPWGHIVEEEWLQSFAIRDYLALDAYVIMPDHLHALVQFTRPAAVAAIEPREGLHRPPHSLGSLIARFKASCTRRINLLRGCTAPPIWQRNYYETIIRNEEHLNRVRHYIERNPVAHAKETPKQRLNTGIHGEGATRRSIQGRNGGIDVNVGAQRGDRCRGATRGSM
jgi:REP element-mobilizing transposase RayT